MSGTHTHCSAGVLIAWLVLGLPAAGYELESVQPNHGEVGTDVEITITGEIGIVFAENSTITFSPAIEITHGRVTLWDVNVIKTTISIPADTPAGIQDVIVSESGLTYIGHDLFEVVCQDCGDPEIVSVSPSSGPAGDSLVVTVTGSDTHFDDTSVLTFSGQGIATPISNTRSRKAFKLTGLRASSIVPNSSLLKSKIF